MFERLKEWWRLHTIRQAHNQYDKGYDYAKGALYSGEITAEQLQAHVSAAKEYGDYSFFDTGIEDAIADYLTETTPI